MRATTPTTTKIDDNCVRGLRDICVAAHRPRVSNETFTETDRRSLLCSRQYPGPDNPFSSLPRGAYAVLHRFTMAMYKHMRQKLYRTFPGKGAREGCDIDKVDELLQEVWGPAVQQVGVIHLHPEPSAAVEQIVAQSQARIVCGTCNGRPPMVPCATDDIWFLQFATRNGHLLSLLSHRIRHDVGVPIGSGAAYQRGVPSNDKPNPRFSSQPVFSQVSLLHRSSTRLRVLRSLEA